VGAGEPKDKGREGGELQREKLFRKLPGGGSKEENGDKKLSSRSQTKKRVQGSEGVKRAIGKKWEQKEVRSFTGREWEVARVGQERGIELGARKKVWGMSISKRGQEEGFPNRSLGNE